MIEFKVRNMIVGTEPGEDFLAQASVAMYVDGEQVAVFRDCVVEADESAEVSSPSGIHGRSIVLSGEALVAFQRDVIKHYKYRMAIEKARDKSPAKQYGSRL